MTGKLKIEERPELAPRDPRDFISVHDAFAATAGGHEPKMGDYWRVLVKRKWTIFAAVIVVVTVAGIISLRMTRIYDAVSLLTIANEMPSYLDLKDNNQRQSSTTEEDNIDTQVRILQSDALALEVIKKMGLDRNPEFAGRATVAMSGGVAVAETPNQTLEREDALIRVIADNINVRQIPNTTIIEITYANPNPQLAADIANAIASTFIEDNIKTRFQSSSQAADWLSKQLADLQIKVEVSQSKLNEYQKEHNIVGVDDKQNLTTTNLGQVNSELMSARLDRIQKESLADMTKRSDAGSIGAVLQDPVLLGLRQQQTELQAEYAQQSTQFGPAYPRVAEIANRLQQVNKTYQEQLANVVSRIQNDYDTAVRREQMLQSALNAQTDAANQLNETAIEYKVLKQEADANRQIYDSLVGKLKEASLEAGLNSSNIRVVAPARVPLKPARPNIPRNMEFALLLGLVGGIALAFTLEALDSSVRTPEQAEISSGLPTIGLIPLEAGHLDDDPLTTRALLAKGRARPANMVAYRDPKSQIAEAYRALRTSILLSRPKHYPQSILVTSAAPQDGKSMTSVNIAIVMAQQGKRVLLIDADLRRPSLHRVFGVPSTVGLCSVLSGEAKSEDAIVPTVQPNLFFMPAGPLPPDPSELLSSASMRGLLAQWREEYDFIVVDSSPILSVTDAVMLSVEVEAVILVVRAGQTAVGALRRSRDLLLNVKADILGIVLNAADLSSAEYYYYSSAKYDN